MRMRIWRKSTGRRTALVAGLCATMVFLTTVLTSDPHDLAMAALQDADQMTQSTEVTAQPTDQPDDQTSEPGSARDDDRRGYRNGRGWRQREGNWRFNRVDIGRYLTGEYNLKIEVLPPSDETPIQLLVDDEPVDAPTAAFLIRLLRQRKFREESEAGPPDGPGMGPGGPPHGDRRPGGFRPQHMTVAGQMLDKDLTPDFILDVMNVIQDLEPNLYGRLTNLQANSPDQFDMEIRRLAFQHAEMIELKRNEPELYELKVRDRQLENESKVLQFEIAMSEPEGDELAEYRQRLHDLLQSRFDVQMQMREFELGKMKSRLDLLASRLDDQKANKDGVIERQLDGILDELLRNR